MKNVTHVKFPWHGETPKRAPVLDTTLDTETLKIDSQPTRLTVEGIIQDYFSCYIADGPDKTRFYVEFDDESPILVSIDKPPRKNARGIHLTGGFDDLDDLGYRIQGAIDDALRDGFDVIHIHELKFNSKDEVSNG